jgi:hypothetical protein
MLSSSLLLLLLLLLLPHQIENSEVDMSIAYILGI